MADEEFQRGGVVRHPSGRSVVVTTGLHAVDGVPHVRWRQAREDGKPFGPESQLVPVWEIPRPGKGRPRKVETLTCTSHGYRARLYSARGSFRDGGRKVHGVLLREGREVREFDVAVRENGSISVTSPDGDSLKFKRGE